MKFKLNNEKLCHLIKIQYEALAELETLSWSKRDPLQIQK